MSSHGRHVWFDLRTSDPKAAGGFYRQLLGYGAQQWSEGEYEMFTVEGGDTVGGVMKLPDEAAAMGAPPHWLGYVSVADLASTVAKVEGLGGSVLKAPTEIPGTGAFAIVADPQGAPFALFISASGSASASDTPRVGDVSWVELMTTDHDAALAFYGELFGWRPTDSSDLGDGWMYQMFGLEKKTFGGAFTKRADMPGPPAWLYYLHVADVQATLDRATELGATVLQGPMQVPGGDLVGQVRDPQGAVFAVHSSVPS